MTRHSLTSSAITRQQKRVEKKKTTVELWISFDGHFVCKKARALLEWFLLHRGLTSLLAGEYHRDAKGRGDDARDSSLKTFVRYHKVIHYGLLTSQLRVWLFL